MSAIIAAASRRLSPATADWARAATGFLRYAGPDEQAVAVGTRCALGHALLQTGRDGEGQPVTDDDRVWLTADARLDDRIGLISKLQAHGQRAVNEASSDPELLLASYRAWGEACVEQLAGDFAFAIWDDVRQVLLCARDQIGVAPLHYAIVGGELLAATALDALLLHPGVGDELDESELADFLVLGRGDFSATAFADIRRVPPAHVLTFAPDGSLSLRRYWRAPSWPPLVRYSERGEYAARFLGLLRTAVEDRISADRLSVQVSGGMDSTTVAALAHETLAARSVPAGSVRGVNYALGGDSGDREAEFAARAAGTIGIELDLLDASTLQPVDPFDDPLPATPEPFPYRWNRLGYEAAVLSAAHARVALTGLGGDPLLGFAPWYWAEWLAHGRWLRLARATLDNARLFADRPHPHLPQSAAHCWARLTAGHASPPSWLAPEFAARTRAAERIRQPAALAASSLDVRSLTSEPMWPTLLSWGDPSVTRLVVHHRHPFCDLRLLAFARALPPYPWLASKRVLRDATVALLPEAVRERPKTPLVQGPRAAAPTSAVERVAQFVAATPGIERFVDRAMLIAEIRDRDRRGRRDLELGQPLGLIYWLAHRRRPRDGGTGETVRRKTIT